MAAGPGRHGRRGAEIANWLAGPEWLVALLALMATTLSGIGTYQKGWIALRHGNLNINALMSIAVTGAVLLRQWPEAAMVMVLFTIAEWIEAKSLDRARNAIRSLLQLTPERATVQQADGSWTDVPVKTAAIGQTVRVAGRTHRPRRRGHHRPVECQPGTYHGREPANREVGRRQRSLEPLTSPVPFEYQVTTESTHSTLARIIHAVEEAQGARAPTQSFVDQFAKVYTPAVFRLRPGGGAGAPVAALTAVGTTGSTGRWFCWSLPARAPWSFLTPVTIVSGLAAAARHGILIKGGVYLEEGHKLAWLAFDKTGTITHGKPAMTDAVLLDAPAGLDAVRIATSPRRDPITLFSHAIAVAGRENGTSRWR